jgi:hypothetical protein
MSRTYNLLVEERQSDPPAIAVIKDVDLSDTKTLRDKLTLVLTEHYDANITIEHLQIPADRHFPRWTISYEIDNQWTGNIEISCIAIY